MHRLKYFENHIMSRSSLHGSCRRWHSLQRVTVQLSSFNHHCNGLASTDAERGYSLSLAEIVHDYGSA